MVGTVIKLSAKLQYRFITKRWWLILSYLVALLYLGALIFGIWALCIQVFGNLCPEPDNLKTVVNFFALSGLLATLLSVLIFSMVTEGYVLTPRQFACFLPPSKPFFQALLWMEVLNLELVLIWSAASPAGTWFALGKPIAGALSIVGALWGIGLIAVMVKILNLRSEARKAKQNRKGQALSGILLLVLIVAFYALFMKLQTSFFEGGFEQVYAQVSQFLQGNNAGVLTALITLTPAAPFLLGSLSAGAGTPMGIGLLIVAFMASLGYTLLLPKVWYRHAALAMSGQLYQNSTPKVIPGAQAEPAGAEVKDAATGGRSVRRGNEKTGEKIWTIGAWGRFFGLNLSGQTLLGRLIKQGYKDPRAITQIGASLYMVAMITLGYYFAGGGSSARVSYALILQLLMFLAMFATLYLLNSWALDSSAFWYQIIAAIPGPTDRKARLLALLTFQVPIMIAVSVGMGLFASLPVSSLLRLLVNAIAFLLVAAMAMLIWSATFAIPGNAPGQSPLKNNMGSRGGSIFTTALCSLGGMIVTIVPIEILIGIDFLINHFAPALWPLGLIINLALGLGAAWVGILAGGAILEERQVSCLRKVLSWPGHAWHA